MDIQNTFSDIRNCFLNIQNNFSGYPKNGIYVNSACHKNLVYYSLRIRKQSTKILSCYIKFLSDVVEQREDANAHRTTTRATMLQLALHVARDNSVILTDQPSVTEILSIPSVCRLRSDFVISAVNSNVDVVTILQ